MSVTEKTLKWDGHEVRTPEGDLYSINHLSRIVWTTYKNGTAFPGWNSSEEAAKAAAQADYEARILSAIEFAPSPRAQALEEAAKLCEKYAQSYQSGLCHYGSIDKDAGRGRQEGHINAGNELATEIRALSSQPVADGWRSMDSAPTNGKHCILCIKDGAFYYSVQGAFQDGRWNCVYRDDVQPLCWMPNVRVPAQFLPASPGASE